MFDKPRRQAAFQHGYAHGLHIVENAGLMPNGDKLAVGRLLDGTPVALFKGRADLAGVVKAVRRLELKPRKHISMGG